jgi:hypothetical protein
MAVFTSTIFIGISYPYVYYLLYKYKKQWLKQIDPLRQP